MSCKSTDDTNIIYAKTAQESADRRKAFIRTWRLKCRAVADSLEEGGEWLHEEFKRRIKTQTVRPSPESAAMLFWALLASARITPRKVDGWQTLAAKPTDAVIDRAA